MSTFKQLHKNDIYKAVGKDSVDSIFKEERLGEYRAVSYNSGESIFQFCEVADSKVTKGEVVAFGDSAADSYKVEAAASTSNVVKAAGVVYTTASVGNGVWVQKKGPNLDQINTDGSVSADSTLTKDSSNAGVLVNGAAAGVSHGFSFQDDSASVVSQGEVYLDFPF